MRPTSRSYVITAFASDFETPKLSPQRGGTLVELRIKSQGGEGKSGEQRLPAKPASSGLRIRKDIPCSLFRFEVSFGVDVAEHDPPIFAADVFDHASGT